MKAIIGKKIEMTQIFTPEGVVLPVTKIQAEPVTVTQIKTVDKDGYAAVQIASGSKRNVNKPLLGHFKGKKYRFVKEFKIEAVRPASELCNTQAKIERDLGHANGLLADGNSNSKETVSMLFR